MNRFCKHLRNAVVRSYAELFQHPAEMSNQENLGVLEFVCLHKVTNWISAKEQRRIFIKFLSKQRKDPKNMKITVNSDGNETSNLRRQ